MQQKHQSEVANLESKHSTEVTMLNDIIRKAKRWFPMLEARLQILACFTKKTAVPNCLSTAASLYRMIIGLLQT